MASTTYSGNYHNPGDANLSFPLLKQPNEDAYLVFQNSGLYNFHHITSASDTVDLSHPDTAVKIRIARPAQYIRQLSFVNGYTDTTNPAKQISLSSYITGSDTIVGADIVYPGKKTFKKYSCSLNFWNPDNTISVGYSNPWCDTVPAAPFLLDDSYFTLVATQNNNFSVQFNKLTPGYYTTSWSSPGFYLSMNAPSDSTVLHPADKNTPPGGQFTPGSKQKGYASVSKTF